MSCLRVLTGKDMQPAVGANSGLATWTNTALPRPETRGRLLWSISMTRSYKASERHNRSPDWPREILIARL